MYDDSPLMMTVPYEQQQFEMDNCEFSEFKEHEKRHADSRRMEMFENNQYMNQRFANYPQFRESLPMMDEQMPAESYQVGVAVPLPRQPGCGCTGGVDYLLGYENQQEL